MKRQRSLLLLLIIFTLASGISFAQESLLMGRVVDENNQGVAGAIIKVSKHKKVIETRSDNDGLYYTKLLPSSSYHIDVFAGHKYLKAKKVYFTATGSKKYYRLRLHDNKLAVEITDKNVFAEARLSNIEADNENLRDLPDWKTGTIMIMKKDSVTGKLVPEYGRPEKMPRMK